MPVIDRLDAQSPVGALGVTVRIGLNRAHGRWPHAHKIVHRGTVAEDISIRIFGSFPLKAPGMSTASDFTPCSCTMSPTSKPNRFTSKSPIANFLESQVSLRASV
jgi:hypothetical protein